MPDDETYECPTCERRDFKRARDVKIHHAKTHDESLSGECIQSVGGDKENNSLHECPTCGRDDFETERDMKIHHSTVHSESIAGVEVQCEFCSKTVRKMPDHAESFDVHFCGTLCQNRWLAEKNQKCTAHEVGSSVVECDYCGGEFRRRNAELRKVENHYCSKSCSAQGRRVDGPSRYNTTWKEQRKKARERDDNQCQSCGMAEKEHQEEYGRALHVHHIKPARTFQDAEKCHRLDNLITLCISCHLGTWEPMAPLRPDTGDLAVD